ncbi:7-cyano-7-deazaguanine synthase [Elizabethkingia anophelis]|uniref:7-cyano-7-deazaguanine synthase n=1 Tax=Elizabethkingia anophelis TaxID=1117645 RepID=UPI0021A2C04F|nr:7-cyano-7-deazaguanine synthase [Elizabethkingia anophelis]MCT3922238.1 7-cyano-7-deazaguanine synthase [Elizabethkingia anophelis]MCT3957672.1 7-cyano-7-deazaguanine synthase [Elizabethkingia anophelis]MCT4061175.1 7-cyano-7-deazaguanine synthase [Elizabethkingia anophelis]MCT4107467.1 7-cyano-7-deazaguanine synthase [Elizabethkingia anophelis]MCT4137554.1 7-cyano-7-deazaguanine synthase [Elizabethkingia anophelis]
MKQAVLLSGGIDSICLTYGIKPNIAYTIDYGQRVADREIYVSKYICQKLGIEHKIIHINCSSLGTGTLAGTESINIAPSEEWWPYRNQLLITLASMQAIKDKVNSLFLASVKSDDFHKDGTSRFYQLIHNLVSYQEGTINIYCPTLEYYSHELVTKYNVPIDLLTIAHSCHISNLACGKCSGCLKQLKVRHEIGIE